jgi:subtilisin family serine protease
VVSVGALNPNGTEARFSNTGPWVRVHERGASVMSTIPAFQGGLEPIARSEAFQRLREAPDPDDYTDQFALWSGTSFAAPLFAGKLAARMVGAMSPFGEPVSRAQAVERAWRVVELMTELRP